MHSFSRLFLAIALFVLISASGPVPALAQNGGTVGGQTNGGTVGGQTNGGSVNTASNVGLKNPLNNINSFPEFLTAILGGVVQIGTIILIMMLVYVGFLFVAARGNAEKLQGAKSALVWTIIGGLILLGATSIQLVIQGTVDSIT
jgi:hypothetical protein